MPDQIVKVDDNTIQVRSTVSENIDVNALLAKRQSIIEEMTNYIIEINNRLGDWQNQIADIDSKINQANAIGVAAANVPLEPIPTLSQSAK